MAVLLAGVGIFHRAAATMQARSRAELDQPNFGMGRLHETLFYRMSVKFQGKKMFYFQSIALLSTIP